MLQVVVLLFDSCLDSPTVDHSSREVLKLFPHPPSYLLDDTIPMGAPTSRILVSRVNRGIIILFAHGIPNCTRSLVPVFPPDLINDSQHISHKLLVFQ